MIKKTKFFVNRIKFFNFSVQAKLEDLKKQADILEY